MTRNGSGTGSGFFQRAGVVAAAVVILGLTFTLGMLVGRQWTRPGPQVATVETPRKGAVAPRRIGLGEVESDKPKGLQDKLTFYQTLTAPPGPATSQAKANPEDKGKPEARPKPDARPPAEVAAAVEDKPTAADGAPEWTVQVGAFKNRKQADAVQRGLIGAGFPAQVSALMADDGQARYRVRVGSFKARGEAERVAERLRAERSLATYVTTN